MVLVTGSLPKGLPDDLYARVIQNVSLRNIRTVVDASGEALRRGLVAKPTVAKGNLEEFVGVLGPLGTTPRQIARSIHRRRGELPSQTIVTLGEQGAVLVSKGRAWYAKPPRISHINPIGTGDAFAAGYMKALLDGQSPREALRLATAAAVSDAVTPEPGLIIPTEMPLLRSLVKVVPLSL